MIELESVPELLRIPPKLYEMIVRFNEKRYFLLEGGRGGGKSQSVGRFLLYLTDKYKLRVICGRETQVTIAESSYTLLCDLIQKYNLNFEVSASKIVSRATGSTITFRGFIERGVFSIQGIEGTDLLWVDESQAISKRTLDTIIPTIRKQTAKVFFTMNRHLPLDPVYATFVGRADCLHIKINYDENPYCTEALKTEATECRKLSEKDYRHIWLGDSLDQSEDAVYSSSELEESKTKDFPLQQGFGQRVAGFDIARFGEDANAVVILEQRDLLNWQLIHTQEWRDQDLNFTTGKILEIINQFHVDYAAIDEDGLGSGPLDMLTHGRNLDHISGFRNTAISAENSKDFGNQRTKFAYKLKDLLRSGHISLNNEKLVSELLSLKYKFDSHQRRLLVSKDQMRKEGVKSPNLADATIYAVSLIFNTVKDKQERPYEPRNPAYSNQPWNPFKQSNNNDRDNLFSIAGIR